MLHLVLDTSIYREKPRLDSPEFKALTYLSGKEKIKIHIPYMVENEFVSHLHLEYKKYLESAISSLSKISNYSNHGDKTCKILEFKNYIENNKNELISERKNSFINWLIEVKAERYSLTSELSEKALKAYFYGDLPFKEAKTRKDIPDSFVYQQILDLKHHDKLHLVINDNKLRESFKDVNCYSTIKEFIEIDKIKSSLEDTLISENKDKIIRVINNNITSEIINHKLKNFLNDNEVIKASVLSEPELEYIFICNIFSSRLNLLEIQSIKHIKHYGYGNFSATIFGKISIKYLPVYNPEEFSPFDYNNGFGLLSYTQSCSEKLFNASCRVSINFNFDTGNLHNDEDLDTQLKEAPKFETLEVQRLDEIKA